MMAHLGLFAPVFERLAFVAVKVAMNSMATTWPALYDNSGHVDTKNVDTFNVNTIVK
ncbi:hypothetical protein DSO57_1033413 [Entomophthora muscae]|uniref:Uncharacterized protein n=1 Tax=Entomophthora muscae TaxID=34485 RepID=A0ACC2SDK3_9FUNG|nr:hypothetical protein DSO57_1033413 [Entomophthora muscae]